MNIENSTTLTELVQLFDATKAQIAELEAKLALVVEDYEALRAEILKRLQKSLALPKVEQRDEDKLMVLLRMRPGMTRREIGSATGWYDGLTDRNLCDKIEQGLIQRCGEGHAGSPYRFYLIGASGNGDSAGSEV